MLDAKENTKTPISKESAEKEFEKFIDFYDVDLEVLDDDQREMFKSAQKKTIGAIMKGRVEFITDGDGRVVIHQHLRKEGSSVVKYGVLIGTAKNSIKSGKNKSDYGRLYALMGSLSGIAEYQISKFEGSDLTTMEALATLFLML